MPLVAYIAALELPTIVALALCIGALVYLIMYYAADKLFAAPLQFMADKIPIIGGALSGAIGWIVSSIVSWAGPWVDGAVYGLVRIVLFLPQLAVGAIGVVVGSFEWIIGAIISINVAALQTAAGIWGAIGSLAVDLANKSGLIGALQTALGATNDTLAWVYRTYVPGQIQSVMATVTQNIANAVGNLERNLRGYIDGIQAILAQDIANAERNISNIEATITNEVWPAIDGVTLDMSKLLPLALPVAFPLALTAIATLELTLGNAMRECVNPTCNALTPFLSMLNIMQDVATLAVLATLVQQSVSNPNGTAHEIASMADDLAGLGRGFAGAFTGLGL